MSMEHNGNYEGNGWKEWEKLVLYRLDELQASVQKLNARVDALSKSQLITRVRLATLGSIAGVIGTGAVFIVKWMFGK